jgi:hypothetical protein
MDWLFCNPMAHHLLGESTTRRHRAGFEPQRASPFKKRVEAPEVLGEAARA